MTRLVILAKLAMLASVVLAVPSYVAAATIYGTIRQDASLLANAQIELRCGARAERGQTDPRGAYRFTLNETGRCQLSVQGSDAVVIILYDEPTRYDFELRQAGGRRQLIRR